MMSSLARFAWVAFLSLPLGSNSGAEDATWLVKDAPYRATIRLKWIHCGAGPRATLYLVIAAKARAVIEGRLLVTSDDVRAAARPVMRHRIFTNFTADSEGVDADKIVQKLLEAVPEPGEKDY